MRSTLPDLTMPRASASQRNSSYLQHTRKAVSFIPLHARSTGITKYAVQGKKGKRLAMGEETPLSGLPAPDLASTGFGFSCGRLRSIDPRPAGSTGWRASRPPVDTLRPSLVCRSRMHSPCGFPSGLERHTGGSRDCFMQAASLHVLVSSFTVSST